MRLPDSLRNRLRAHGFGSGYLVVSGCLSESFSHFDCGCPGTWILGEEPRWYEPWQRPVMTLVWTCSVAHRRACRRAT